MIPSNKDNTATFELKQQIFYPISTNPSLTSPWFSPDRNLLQSPAQMRHRDAKSIFWQSICYHFLKISLASLCIIPTESLIDFKPINTLDKIMMGNTLTIATTDNFVDDQYIHSYGLNVVARYANHLGVTLDIQHFDDAKDATLAVQLGQADMLVSTNGDNNLKNLSVNCKANHPMSAHFSFKQQGMLFLNAQNYLCNRNTQAQNKQMAKFYQTDLLHGYSQMHFDKIMAENLPKYQNYFQKAAQTYGHDWRLLVAIAYQESHLDTNATSPTGVQGIMMLTQDTAKEMGISDRTDADQSIQGGAKYLAKINDDFAHISSNERLWFILSGYNMGPNAVLRIQDILEQSGKNRNSWSDFYAYLNEHKHINSRYAQCLHYVTNIRAFLEEIHTQNPKSSNPSV